MSERQRVSEVFVTLPDPSWDELLGDVPAGVEIAHWDLTAPPPRDDIDYVVVPYEAADRLPVLTSVRTGVVQTFSVGYDGHAHWLPAGHRLANGEGVHETATAELGVALILAAQRNLPGYAASIAERRWEDLERPPGLADRHVLLLGYGGIGTLLERLLTPFGVRITRVARTARVEHGNVVHAFEDLSALLTDVDVVANSLPLSDETRGLIDDEVLAGIRDGALFVNVGRGPTVDTAALLRHVRSGRIRAALDVIDPEPLPADHEAWGVPGLLLTPHVGGFSDAGPLRVASLLQRQLQRLADGLEPLNVVLDRREVVPT